MALTLEQIEAVAPRAPVSFPVPEWGGDVLLRYLPAHEKDAYEVWAAKAQAIPNGMKNFRAKLVAMCMVGDDLKRLYADDKAVARLGEKDGEVIGRIFAQCEVLNHMGSAVAKQQAAVDAAKNSESCQTGDSPTG